MPTKIYWTELIGFDNTSPDYGVSEFIARASGNIDSISLLVYNIDFVNVSDVNNMDAVILAVSHEEFSKLAMKDIDSLFGEGKKVLLDVKGLLDRNEYEEAGYCYWRL
jgi:UDP-N-acetyl-D-galactosamine dehydrogenase